MPVIEKTVYAILTVVLLSLGACATDPGARKELEIPVAQRSPANDEQQRAKIHTDLGMLYLQQERFEVALEEAKLALAADSSYALAYSLLGMTYMALNDMRTAEENLQRALSYAPQDPEINNNYGWYLCQNKQEKRAVEYFQRALSNPFYKTPAIPNTNAGICLLRIKDYAAAAAYLNKAWQIDPGNVIAVYWLAEMHYRQGNYQDSRQLLHELSKMMDPTAETLWLSIRVERKLGDREAEARLVSQLRRRFNGSLQYQLYTQGKFE